MSGLVVTPRSSTAAAARHVISASCDEPADHRGDDEVHVVDVAVAERALERRALDQAITGALGVARREGERRLAEGVPGEDRVPHAAGR